MPTKDNLMESLASPENLLNAWRSVRGNIPRYRRERSAGPDGLSLAEFERDLPAQLSALRHMLLKGAYQPQAPGLFSVPKKDGNLRQIAMLNVADRVAQRAAQQVLEPLYEPFFLPCSFGFRPGRSIQDAVYCAGRLRRHGYAWVVDGDIAACFDSLDHQILMEKVKQQVKDTRFLELLQKWLGLGILEHGVPAESPNPILQGWNQASTGMKKGFDWVLNSWVNPEPFYDPLPEMSEAQSLHSTMEPGDSESIGSLNEGNFGDGAEFYAPAGNDGLEQRLRRQRAIRQVLTGGLLLGSGWARSGLAKAVPAALAALKSSTGSILLKRSLLIGGGAVGAVAGVAIAGCLLYRKVTAVPVGVLQGSPLSPLLANIYLHSFDLAVTHAGYRLVRFADDWVIFCPDQNSAEHAYNQATIALSKIHLKINPTKTRLLAPTEKLEWLGTAIG
jgi:RNA-directed DNA polymerase